MTPSPSSSTAQNNIEKSLDSSTHQRKISTVLIPCLAIVALLTLLPHPLAHAKLPPSAYLQMQEQASEHLNIEVVRSEISPPKPGSAAQAKIVALIHTVHRSASQLTPGTIILITYLIDSHSKSHTSHIPLPKIGQKSVAYLNPTSKPKVFMPAAGPMSFQDF